MRSNSYPIVEQESGKGVNNTTYLGCPGEYDFGENPKETQDYGSDG